MIRVRAGGWLVALAAVFAGGCGGGDTTGGVTVTGQVTFDGAPLTAGQVVFEVANGEQRVGGLGEDGRYEVKDVPAGKVKAAVRTSFLQGQAAADRNFATKAGGKAEKTALVLVPARYENPTTANLEFEVAAGKPINIELKK